MSLTTEKPTPEKLPDSPSSAPSTSPAQPRRWRKWVVILGALLVVVLIWRGVGKSSAKADEGGRGGMDARPIPVVAGTVEQRDFPLYLEGLGTAQAFNSVTVKARVDGELQQIFFVEGQEVQKGMQLAQIDPRPYQSQYDQAAAKTAQDEAQLGNAQLALSRNESLIKNGVIDKQTYDTQRYGVAQLQALVKADQAAQNNAQTQLDYTKLLSPITGRVGIRLVDEGNIVRAGDDTGIVVINQVQPISVAFTLPQQQLGEVREAVLKNQKLSVLAVDRDNSSTLSEGELAVVDNQIDATTATVKLKATFANQDLKLWPGQFVNVRLLLGIKKDAICLPTAAVQRGPNGSFVYVIQPDMTVAMRTVKVGDTEGDLSMITEGLKAGEQVVVDGQYRLKLDSKVTITPPAAAQGTPAQ